MELGLDRVPKTGLTRASSVVLLVIILSVAGVVGYGGYHYVSDHPSLLNFLHGGSSGSETSSSTTQTPSPIDVPSSSFSTISINTRVNATTSSGATVYYAVTSTSNSSISPPPSATANQTTSVGNSTKVQSSIDQSSQSIASQTNWPFVLASPAIISVGDGDVHLNVSYTNTQSTSETVYLSATISSTSNSRSIGSPPLTVSSGQSLSYELDLGELTIGSYSVSFYLIDTSTGMQASAVGTVPFTV